MLAEDYLVIKNGYHVELWWKEPDSPKVNWVGSYIESSIRFVTGAFDTIEDAMKELETLTNTGWVIFDSGGIFQKAEQGGEVMLSDNPPTI